jgi:copper chaperone
MQSFNIPNLNCGHCVRAVTEAVQATDPTALVKADPATKLVEVQSTATRETLVAQLTEAGYAPA